jgi:hypothetical protein
MSTHDWLLPARYPLCEFSDSYYRSAQPLFSNLTGAITPELVAAVTNALEQLRADLEQQLFPMHFGLSVGRHRCVRQLHQEAIARLRCLAAVAKPEQPPPAPPQPLRTLKEVVRSLGQTPQPPPDLFPVGIEEELPDLEHPG